jgi:predicted nucleotide-binding protein (sugar kinase/HSP70/actin superfamily)
VYGHVQSLLDIDADFIFLPSVMDRETEVPGQNQSLYCPYISASAYMVAAQMRLRERGYPLLLTPLHFRNDSFKRKDLQTLAGQMGVPYRKVKQADAAAMAVQQQFYATVRQRGRSVLENLPADQPAAVIVGRPYNIHDLAISQDLPLKLRRLGVQPIPMDYLPLDTVDVSREFPNMNWRSGQDLLAAAALVRNDPRLHAIYVTNFSCGPDSFVLGYFERLMGDKPFLELEMDEHTADAGIITRCEAFFDSLRMAQEAAYTRQTLDSTNAAPEDTTEELEYLTAAV